MEFSDVVCKRRSVREYQKQEIPLSTVKDILKLASHAPYPKAKSNWHTIVFHSQEKQELNKELLKYLLLKKDVGHSTHNSIKTCIKAPVLLLIYSIYSHQTNSLHDELLNHSYIQSSGAYIQNILLCATNLGLGSLWVNDILFFQDEIASYVGESDRLVSCVLLGVPSITPGQKNIMEKELNYHIFGK